MGCVVWCGYCRLTGPFPVVDRSTKPIRNDRSALHDRAATTSLITLASGSGRPVSSRGSCGPATGISGTAWAARATSRSRSPRPLASWLVADALLSTPIWYSDALKAGSWDRHTALTHTGSSLLVQLTNLLALDALRVAGLTHITECAVLPLATGMTMTLALLTLADRRRQELSQAPSAARGESAHTHARLFVWHRCVLSGQVDCFC